MIITGWSTSECIFSQEEEEDNQLMQLNSKVIYSSLLWHY